MAGIGLQLAQHQSHQAGLATAVLAGDADLVARNRLKLASANRMRGPRRRLTESNLSTLVERLRGSQYGAVGMAAQFALESVHVQINPVAYPGNAAAVLAGFLAMPAMADIGVTEGWVRATVPGTKVAAAYFVLTNKGDKERALLRIGIAAVRHGAHPHQQRGQPGRVAHVAGGQARAAAGRNRALPAQRAARDAGRHHGAIRGGAEDSAEAAVRRWPNRRSRSSWKCDRWCPPRRRRPSPMWPATPRRTDGGYWPKAWSAQGPASVRC